MRVVVSASIQGGGRAGVSMCECICICVAVQYAFACMHARVLRSTDRTHTQCIHADEDPARMLQAYTFNNPVSSSLSKQIDIQRDRRTNRQTDRRTDRQTDEQSETEIDKEETDTLPISSSRAPAVQSVPGGFQRLPRRPRHPVPGPS